MNTGAISPAIEPAAAVPPLRTGGRNHQLDLLRILFATLVLLSHAPELTDGNQSRELFQRLTHTPVTFGAFGVDGFFLLSGFLIVQSWDRDPQLYNFLQKRVLRIVPGYLVAVLLTTAIAGLVAPGIPHFFEHLDYRFIYSIVALREPSTPAVFPGMPIASANGSLWTIFYEFHCYLGVALFGLCGIVKRPWLWLLATAAFTLGCFSPHLQSILSRAPLPLITGEGFQLFHLTAIFLVGGCYYLFRKRLVFHPIGIALAAVVLVATDLIHPRGFEVALVLAGSYLLFYLERVRLPGFDWMRHVPDISYGMYLYGWTVESLFIWYRTPSPWLTFLGSTVICAGLGWLSWHYIERPMLKLKRDATAPLPPP